MIGVSRYGIHIKIFQSVDIIEENLKIWMARFHFSLKNLNVHRSGRESSLGKRLSMKRSELEV